MIFKHEFKFGEHWLSEFGGFIEGNPQYETAERDGELVEIAGKSGDIYIDNKRYKNVPFEREVWICNKTSLPMSTFVNLARDWLAGAVGYKEFRDTYNPDCVTWAKVEKIGDAVVRGRRLASFNVQFNRVPYWYTDDGQRENEIDLVAHAGEDIEIINPTSRDSAPVFRLYCPFTGADFNNQYINLTVNGEQINYGDIDYTSRFSTGLNCFLIDCENEQVGLIGTESGNYKAYDKDLPPNLNSGVNTIRVEVGNFSPQYAKLTIQPNWRRL